LGNLVFADPLLRAKLNEITHPAIRSVWQREREERARTHPTYPLAVMIPLLFECELEKLFSAVWCVGASRAMQLRRLAARGLSDSQAAARIDSQMPVADKMARSHAAFWGEGTPAVLLAQLDHIRIP
jgi:dephospho-CoA kinase